MIMNKNNKGLIVIPELRVLERLSYILECIIIGATSELKVELPILIEKLKKDKDYQFDGYIKILDLLKEANDRRDTRDHNEITCSILSKTSRELWEIVLNKILIC